MIDLRPIVFVIGILLLFIAAVPLLPVGYLVFNAPADDANIGAFLATSIVSLALGVPMAVSTRRANFRLVPRQMYLLTVLSWLVVSVLGAIPFLLSTINMSFVDSIFETVSGITTTGSTVLTGLDTLPHSILLWRSLLQWVGGIGIVVMVVAILPHLGVGGMRLFRSEASDKSEKFTARSRNVAQYIGVVYVVLTASCALLYWVAGMDSFNAVLHSMTTISTGGYSTSDLSMRQFASSAVTWTSCVFMFLSGLPFVLLGQMLRGKPKTLLDDQQVRGYAFFVLSATLIVCSWLIYFYEMSVFEALSVAAFSSISIITTTGYVTNDYNLWGGLAVGAFFFMTFVGACAGSTAGGIKIFRFQIALLMLRNQIKAMVHPRGIYSSYYNRKSISSDITTSVIAFSFVFTATVALLAIALSITGLDLITSLSGAATAVANVGPGLGDTIGPAGSFAALSDTAKWLIIIGMLMGRLEILTVLVLFTAVFWRG